MAKFQKLLNLAPDWWRSKTMWLSFCTWCYVLFKYSQHLISLDGLINASYVIFFGATLRDTIAKLYPALLAILGGNGGKGSDGGQGV